MNVADLVASSRREFDARLSEIEDNFSFVRTAVSLRPQIGAVVNWSTGGPAVDLARVFMDAKAVRVEGVYGALFVQVVAALERHIRHLVVWHVKGLEGKASTIDDVSARVRAQNVILTGRALSTYGSAPDHLAFDYEQMATNLGSCRGGVQGFRLNAEAFKVIVTGSAPSTIETVFKCLGVEQWWDDVGRSPAMQAFLSTRRIRQTGDAAKSYLRDVWRRRNALAHAGDSEVAIGDTELTKLLGFVRVMAVVLEDVLQDRIAAA